MCNDQCKFKIANGKWVPYPRRTKKSVSTPTPEQSNTSTVPVNKNEPEPHWMKELEKARKETAEKFKRRPRTKQLKS